MSAITYYLNRPCQILRYWTQVQIPWCQWSSLNVDYSYGFEFCLKFEQLHMYMDLLDSEDIRLFCLPKMLLLKQKSW